MRGQGKLKKTFFTALIGKYFLAQVTPKLTGACALESWFKYFFVIFRHFFDLIAKNTLFLPFSFEKKKKMQKEEKMSETAKKVI